jgi:hypothetical protein
VRPSSAACRRSAHRRQRWPPRWPASAATGVRRHCLAVMLRARRQRRDQPVPGQEIAVGQQVQAPHAAAAGIEEAQAFAHALAVHALAGMHAYCLAPATELVAVGAVQAQHGAERGQLCRRRPGRAALRGDGVVPACGQGSAHEVTRKRQGWRKVRPGLV